MLQCASQGLLLLLLYVQARLVAPLPTLQTPQPISSASRWVLVILSW